MPQNCAVPFCSEKKGGHRFPKDKTVTKQWLVAIGREDYTPSKYALVCKKHFKPDDYELPKEPTSENPTPRLKPKVVPSRFSWNQESVERKGTKRKCAERALPHLKKRETATPCSNTEEDQRKISKEYITLEEIKIEFENYNKDVSVQCSLCKCQESLTYTANLSEHESNKSNRKNKLNLFRIENVKEKPEVVQFYTGFDDYNHFMLVFNLFGDGVNNLKHSPSLHPIGGKHALTPADQFYLTLIKLRRNMCNKELSFHFEISETSVGECFITWINYLYCKFKDLNISVPKETIDETVMSQMKSNNTNNHTVTKDDKETNIEKPQNLVSALATCKPANTLKVLVGISGAGCVNFVSDAYAGSVSDRELFEKCGISNEHEKGGIIPGDCGFIKQDPLSHMDATVNMPQFLKKDSNMLEAQQLSNSKTLSSECFNVKRVIGLGKTYNILSDKLSSNLLALGGRIIFVCFMLANFKKNKCK